AERGPAAALDPAKEWYTKAELARALDLHPGSVPTLIKRSGLAARGNGKARRYPRATAEALRDRFEPVGPATVNHYLRSIKSFLPWLVKDRRTPDNPLAHLADFDATGDIRHRRRALTAGELSALLAATLSSPRAFRGLGGADRFALYATAMGSGL